VLAVASAATLLVLVAYTDITVTMAASGDALGASAGARAWILSGMSLGLAAALLSAGTLADRRGHRRVFGWAAALLAATSAVGALAPSSGVLVAARVLTGAAGAGMLVTGLAAVGVAFPDGAARARATAVWGAMLGGGIALGPLLGALANALSGWRAGYWLVAVLALLLVPGCRALGAVPTAPGRRFDVPGGTAFACGMACATAAAVAGRQGWQRPLPLTLTLAAAGGLALFVAIERRRRAPLLDLGLLRRRPFRAATLGALLTGLAVISLMSCLPAFLVVATHASVLTSAAVLGVWSTTSMVVALATRRLPVRIDSAWRLLAGVLLVGVGEALLTGLADDVTWPRLVPGLAVAGVGSGLANAALGHLAVSSLPEGLAGLGAGINTTARYFGAAAGTAVVLAISGGGGSGHRALVHGWNVAALTMAALCLLGALPLAAWAPRRLS